MSADGPTAETALRLVLGAPEAVEQEVDPFNGDGVPLIGALRANVVLVRAADRCRSLGLRVPGLAEAAERERERIGSVVRLLARITAVLDDGGIPFVLTKAFQHYPDMGHDIDLFVDDTTARADGRLAATLGARAAEGSALQSFAGKRTVRVPGHDVPIEIHHGRLGHLGEHRAFARGLARRHRRVEIAGIAAPVPAAGDHLVLQVLQRICAHRRIRASDAVLVLALASGPSDVASARATAASAGLGAALEDLLGLVAGIARSADLVAPVTSRELAPPPPRLDGYAVPLARVVGAYAATAAAGLRERDLERTARVAALPALAIATAIDRAWSRLSSR